MFSEWATNGILQNYCQAKHLRRLENFFPGRQKESSPHSGRTSSWFLIDQILLILLVIESYPNTTTKRALAGSRGSRLPEARLVTLKNSGNRAV